MSEDDRDVDVESDEEDSDRRRQNSGNMSLDRRAHHNALERKRRDHIKDSFTSLRDAIPTMQGDKSSRAQILRKASEYISFMRRKQSGNQQDIEDLKRQNSHLEKQIKVLERAKSTGNYSSAAEILEENGLNEDAANLVSPRQPDAAGGAEFSSAYDAGAGSDTSESSSGQQQQQNGGVAVMGVAGAARVIAPGQSLLLSTNGGDQPPRKKMKS